MKKVFLDAFKAALKGKIWRWLLGSVSAVSCVFLACKAYFGLSLLTSVLVGVSLIITLFLIRYFDAFFKLAYKHFHFKYQEVIYGEAIILLKDSFAQINSLRKSNFDDKTFLITTKLICDNLKLLFDKKTKSSCSVSIKVPQSGMVSAGDSVDNLCRDTKHSSRDTEDYKKTNHTIIGNTAYTKILNGVQRREKDHFYYINPNIPETPDYENTSCSLYTDGILPYRSEIVYPILPILRDINKTEDFYIWGFICIDCDTINGFDSKYDKAIIEGVADGVHDILMARHSFKTKQHA